MLSLKNGVLFFTLFMGQALAQVTYSVPVPVELAAFATFTSTDTSYQQIDDELTLSYTLPLELTGHAQARITLSGKRPQNGHFKLQGPEAQAFCEASQLRLLCLVSYQDLQIDEAEVETYIKEKFTSPQEQIQRLQVARLFSGEPIGIIELVWY